MDPTGEGMLSGGVKRAERVCVEVLRNLMIGWLGHGGSGGS